MRPIRRIVVHCSATPEGAHYTAADIRRWHLARGFVDIGYHAVVLLDGTIEDGRPPEQIGAHVAGRNEDSLGICFIGGVVDDSRRTPKDTRTPRQRAALLSQVRSWMELYGVPVEHVYGHYELDGLKACPSFPMLEFRRELAAAPDLTQAAEPDMAASADALCRELEQAITLVPARDLRRHPAAAAARALQREIGVTADGILGPKTRGAIARYLAEAAWIAAQDIDPDAEHAPPTLSYTPGEVAGHD